MNSFPHFDVGELVESVPDTRPGVHSSRSVPIFGQVDELSNPPAKRGGVTESAPITMPKIKFGWTSIIFKEFRVLFTGNVTWSLVPANRTGERNRIILSSIFALMLLIG